VGGAYVRLALPASGVVGGRASSPDSVGLAHEYCYPSIDTVVPPPSAAQMSEPQLTPPPLPMKSGVGWRDRRNRRHGRVRGAMHIQLSSLPRMGSYGGTENSVVTVPATHAVSMLASSVSSRLSMDGSGSDCRSGSSGSSCRSRFLHFFLPCVQPCRRHHRRRGFSSTKRRTVTRQTHESSV
jgi:hypothetical protein